MLGSFSFVIGSYAFHHLCLCLYVGVFFICYRIICFSPFMFMSLCWGLFHLLSDHMLFTINCAFICLYRIDLICWFSNFTFDIESVLFFCYVEYTFLYLMCKKQCYSSLHSKLKGCIIHCSQYSLPLENCVPVKKLELHEWLKCFPWSQPLYCLWRTPTHWSLNLCRSFNDKALVFFFFFFFAFADDKVYVYVLHIVINLFLL